MGVALTVGVTASAAAVSGPVGVWRQALVGLIERVCPANVVIIWNADPVGNGWLTCGA